MIDTPSQAQFPGLKFLVALAALVIVVLGLREAQDLLIPLLFSFFLAILGAPAMYTLQRCGLPKILAVLVVALIFIALVVGLGTVLGRSVNEFTSSLPRYTQQFNSLYLDLQAWLREYHIELSSTTVFSSLSPSSVMDLIAGALRRLVGALSSLMLVMIVVIFMLFEAADFRAKLQVAMREAFDDSRMRSVAVDVQRYLGIKTVTCVITGVSVGLLNWAMGVDFALLWGVIAFLMNYVPFIGSILASVPAIILSLILFGVPSTLLLVVGYVAVNIGVSNFLEPVLMGRRLGLSPLVVFLSLVVWGWIWGPAGMLLSVPLTMMVKILLEHSQEFRWVAVLMGNRPR